MKVVKYTTKSDFPDVLPNSRTGYCFSCKVKLPDTFFSRNGSFSKEYICASCGQNQNRILLWDPSLKQYFDKSNLLIHESVGVIVLNENNEVLLFYRSKFPVSYTIPAGHIDNGEDSKDAGIRELEEETGLNSEGLHLLSTTQIKGDSCSRRADIHQWHLYATKVTNTKVVLTDEGQHYGWYQLNSLPDDLTLPTATFLKNQNILNKLKKL